MSLTKALTKSVHTRAACFPQSMFSIKLVSHFSKSARSLSFGLRLTILNQMPRSHGKLQNPEHKLTSWMVFFLSSG